MLLQEVKGLIQIIAKFRTEKKYLCMFLSSTPNTSIFLNVVIMHKILCTKYCTAVTLTRNEWTVYISLKDANWHVLQIAKTQFRYTIWFGISEKGITRYTFLDCGGAHIYQTSQQTRHSKKTVCQNFQSFNP